MSTRIGMKPERAPKPAPAPAAEEKPKRVTKSTRTKKTK